MTDVILYTTAGCHLCELAQDILQSLPTTYKLNIIPTEIGDDDALVERYGIKIPVLMFADNSELNWPFSAQDIESVILANGKSNDIHGSRSPHSRG